jgi:transcription initiation factor TFIID subunit 10
MSQATNTVKSTISNTVKNNKLIWSDELCDFLSAIDTYNPTMPEAVSKYYLEKSGVNIKDERILKLVSLASDYLLTDIIHEAKQISLLRQQSSKYNNKRKADMIDTLELVDLETVLSQATVYIGRKKNKNED